MEKLAETQQEIKTLREQTDTNNKTLDNVTGSMKALAEQATRDQASIQALTDQTKSDRDNTSDIILALKIQNKIGTSSLEVNRNIETDNNMDTMEDPARKRGLDTPERKSNISTTFESYKKAPRTMKVFMKLNPSTLKEKLRQSDPIVKINNTGYTTSINNKQNERGVKTSDNAKESNSSQASTIGFCANANKVDILGIAKTNLNWQFPGMVQQCRQQLSELWDHLVFTVTRLVIRHCGLDRLVTISRNGRKRVALAELDEGFFLTTTRWIRRGLFLRIMPWIRRDFSKFSRRSLKAAVKDCA